MARSDLRAAGRGSGSEEKKLLARLRAGEGAAYEEFVRGHGPRLFAVVRRYLKNEEDAQDAVQEAFLAAFRSIGSFEGEARLSTWMHRIAVNAALMKLRTRRRKPETSIDGLLPEFLEDGHMMYSVVEWQKLSDEVLAQKQTRELVQACIEQLPEGYRHVLLLRDIEALSTEETAEIMGITSSAVKTRLHRARLALRGLLDPHMRRSSL